MKARILLVLLVVFTVSIVSAIPQRYSMRVSDATEAYNPDWIVSPSEEPKGDQSVSNAPECDIKGIISCFDENQLRVDILLYNSIKRKVEVWYAVKFEYTDCNEYYTYYPSSETFIYEKEVDGSITETETLDMAYSSDFAGVTSSGGVADTDVYIVIDKNKHIGGSKGKQYYLTSDFYSGYVDNNNNMKVADQTIQVDLYFTK